MNTLKSGTTIVVLLGVLYGVYVVLSKPERLRELKLPGASTAQNSAQGDPGPSIEFGGGGHAGHAHAEPHLAVETGTPKGLALESGSPASSPPPSSVAAVGMEASPASVGSPGGSTAGSGSSYGASSAGGGSYGQPGAGPSAYGQSSSGQSAYGAPSSAMGSPPAAAGYGGGSRYSVTSGAAGNLADSGNASAYGAGAGNVYQATSQEPTTGYGSPPVQQAYGVTASTSGAAGAGAHSDSSAEVRSDALNEYSLRQMWAQAEQLVSANKYKDALAVLSSHYSRADLPSEHRAVMVPWLDALAARVIYSKQHLLELPYEARAKETLFDIQERFNVPWQLLQNINSDVVTDPQVLVVGTSLKVVKGPFRADVELSRNEITVYLGELYAGRFPFTLGNEPVRPGQYKVVDKRLDRAYYGAEGTIPAGDPTNPYGGVWMDLGREVSIHGSPTQSGATETLGCISLSPQDAKDLYSILSPSSEVVIR